MIIHEDYLGQSHHRINMFYFYFYIAFTITYASMESLASNFPKDFIFGTATAAYQVEGAYDEDGRGMSIWDKFSNIPGKIYNDENGNIADDHYHRFPQDLELLKTIGVQAYRLSLSWTRILPTGRLPINQAGIDHYSHVFDKLVEAGITPFVTLYHWDLPQSLEDEYEGWLSENITEDFNTFADICFREFGDRVKNWITINEPWTTAVNGYGVGIFAPGRCSDRSKCEVGNSYTEPYVAGHNMILSHARVVQTYREYYQKTQGGQIGMVINMDFIRPRDPNSAKDKIAAEQRMEFQFAWWADPLTVGHYPESMRRLLGERLPQFTPAQAVQIAGTYDFIGLNHYTSYFAEYKPLSVTGSGFNWWDFWDSEAELSPYDLNGELIGPKSESTWLFKVPAGIKQCLLWVNNRYPNKDIYITENGCPAPEESKMTANEAYDDAWRIDYLQQYTENAIETLDQGVPLRGYFVWSLMDNFEWADGYSKRFGIVYVDYDNGLKRSLKKSAVWYGDFIAKNTANVESYVTVTSYGLEEEQHSSANWLWLLVIPGIACIATILVITRRKILSRKKEYQHILNASKESQIEKV
mmetsp:Transcript_3067/g.4367  ORF Transcript_3067/g.4367 Transcript_3067/m.4367 type:complete len:583 (+) Transcript_3067:158-1906(+)